MGQTQEGLEPGAVDVAIILDVGPGELPADGGTNGNDQDVEEVMATGFGAAWIGEVLKEVTNGKWVRGFHTGPPARGGAQNSIATRGKRAGFDPLWRKKPSRPGLPWLPIMMRKP